MFVLGRRAGQIEDASSGSRLAGAGDARGPGGPDGPTGHLGHYRARDGSAGRAVALDLDGPHAACVVGKRGSGKSYTLGVLAESLAVTDGVAPLVCDPMGAFGTLAEAGFRVLEPRVRATALPARTWPDLLGLDPADGPGSLVWRAATERERLAGMLEYVTGSDAPASTRRAATNHLRLAASWDVFDPDAPAIEELLSRPTVLSLASLAAAPANAVVRAVASACYRARVDGRVERLPWLLVDEAHVFFDGLAAPALRRLLTRGRAPGVSLVCATQRPTALPEVARSQADLLVVHRLTSAADREAVRQARPGAGERESLAGRWPTAPGEALVLDDATDAVHAVRVRERRTTHGGASPSASAVDAPGPGDAVDAAKPTATRSPPRSE